jgi:membrane protein implicated in regulation of membrane protease activity
MRWLQDAMASWPIQLAILALYVGLAILVLRRVSRDWQDEGGPRNRWFLGAVVALGVFVVLQFALGSSLFGAVTWPAWLEALEFLWLAGLWVYYLARFMTRQRSGPGDDESRRRGAALDKVIAPLGNETHRTTGA